MDDPNNPAIIAVLGVTGSGKSSFIKRVTGNEDIVIGDDLNSSNDHENIHEWPMLTIRGNCHNPIVSAVSARQTFPADRYSRL